MKVMVVEDDAALREIYSIRITAEGYEVVSAGDGEEALAVAVREKPDLILSDVMMPKISGFDMLDILRATPETANIKVVMMTALSSDDQRARGERLGADRYLVKSQVGIEDVVNTIHEVLGDKAAAPAPAPAAPAPTPAPAPAPEPAAPVAPAAPMAPAPAPSPVAAPQVVDNGPIPPATPAQ
ncbi:response regulator [Candidatus Saccharibacteria bacterium]|nr:response regulator [Candidatus Saccharibacteria bacterium]